MTREKQISLMEKGEKFMLRSINFLRFDNITESVVPKFSFP